MRDQAKDLEKGTWTMHVQRERVRLIKEGPGLDTNDGGLVKPGNDERSKEFEKSYGGTDH